MEDQSFELITKIYSEMTKGFDKVNVRLDGIDGRLDGIDVRLDKLEAGQVKIEITLENEIKSNLQAMHERAEINTSKLDEHSEKLNTIENKLDYLALSVNSQDKRLETIEVLRKKSIK